MVNVNLFGNRVSIVTGLKSTHKTMVLRNVPRNAEFPSEAQAAARLVLSEFAYNNLYGMTGTVTLPDGRIISRAAYYVMTQYPNTGQGAFGGRPPQERAAMRHEASLRSIERQRARASELAGAGRLPAVRCPPGTML